MSDLIVLLWPIWYFVILLSILRYARLKPKLSKFIGVSLAVGSTTLFLLSILYSYYDPDALWHLVIMLYCFMIAIVGVIFIIGASQKITD